jgi:hypothetical protein
LPKYAQIPQSLLEVFHGVPGHDLLFHGIKEVLDENELMFGGSDSGELLAYFGNPGCF